MKMTREQLRVEFADSWCGCGNPEEGYRLVRQVLLLCPLYDHRPEFEELIPDTGVEMIVLGLLDNLGLIEHGGGIGGSWLTSKGEAALKALNREAHDGFESLADDYCIHGNDFNDPEHDCMNAPEPKRWDAYAK